MSSVKGNPLLSIFFGSQTGNAEELAGRTKKMSEKLGFKAEVIDMDGYDPSGFSSLKRVLIICLLYTSPSPRDKRQSRMPWSA